MVFVGFDQSKPLLKHFYAIQGKDALHLKSLVAIPKRKKNSLALLNNQKCFFTDYEFIVSRIGTRLIKIGDKTFSMHFTRQVGNLTKTRWRCSHHSTFNCKAAIYTFDNEIMPTNLEHNNHQSEVGPICPGASFHVRGG